jgi:hypothetical protein
MTTMTSAFIASLNGAVTAPLPMPSISAATELAWHRRVQWSTLFEPKPVLTSFWNRNASSFEHLAEPKPASARPPSRSRIVVSPWPASSSASSQEASRKCVHGFAGSTQAFSPLGAPCRRTSGLVSRCGWRT